MQNFFHSLFKSKLDAMRAAAPRASVHLLHESNGFSIYLDEATAVRKITQLGVLTDHAEDILEETVPVLFIPLEQCVRFVEEMTPHHSVGLVDVILADKVNNARYVMYAYFGKRATVNASSGSWAGEWDYSDAQRALRPKEKDSLDADFWG